MRFVLTTASEIENIAACGTTTLLQRKTGIAMSYGYAGFFQEYKTLSCTAIWCYYAALSAAGASVPA